MNAPRYRMKGRVVLRRIGPDRLLVPVAGDAAQENCVFPVNETGEFMWNRLSVGVAPEQVAEEVAREFTVSADAATADCRAFAGELVANHLLEEQPS